MANASGVSGFQGLINALGGGRRFRREVPPTEEVGTSGAYATGGFLYSTERNPKAKGDQKWLTYSDLLANVAIVAAGVRAYLNLLAKSSWNLVPADVEESEMEASQEAADLVHDVINDMERPWSRVVRRSGMYRFYGFGVQEWTAKARDDGSIGMLDVAPRPAATINRWALDDAGNVLGMTQRHPKSGREVFLPRDKVIHIVDDALSDSPEGVGIFRHLIEPNHRLKRYQELEAIGFDQDLRGIPIGRAPYGKLKERVDNGELTAAQRQKIVQPLEDFISNHINNLELGLVLDSQTYLGQGENEAVSSSFEWDVSLLTGSSTSASAVAAAISRITWEMATVMGVQGLLLGSGGAGSLALGRSYAEQFALLVDSGLLELAQAYEHDLVPMILLLNGIDQRFAPTFATQQTNHLDVEQVTGSLRDMSDAGAPLDPDDPAINAVRDMVGLPQVDLEARAEAASLLAEQMANRPPPPPPGPLDPEADPAPDPDEPLEIPEAE